MLLVDHTQPDAVTPGWIFECVTISLKSPYPLNFGMLTMDLVFKHIACFANMATGHNVHSGSPENFNERVNALARYSKCESLNRYCNSFFEKWSASAVLRDFAKALDPNAVVTHDSHALMIIHTHSLYAVEQHRTHRARGKY
jgi:hypothetical protein